LEGTVFPVNGVSPAILFNAPSDIGGYGSDIARCS
jgi:hypothetical protein